MPHIELKRQSVKTIKIPKPRLLALLAGILIGFLLVFSGQKYFFGKKITSNSANVLSSSDEKKPLPADLKNLKTLGILLLGYGGSGHPGGFLTDAIQVAIVDFEKAKIYLISVPRDLWVKFPNGTEGKINTALNNLSGKSSDPIPEGGKAMQTFLGNILGLKIDYFAAIDFVGFQRAIGINLKGIDVEVSETLDDPWYPIEGQELATCGMTATEIAQLSAKYSGFELEKQFPCRYEHLHFDQGTVTMQGGDALKYVRSRHGSAEGDISRGKRQQEVLAAVKKKLLSLNSLTNLPGFFKEIAVHTQTDVNLDIIKYLDPLAQKAFQFKVENINLSTKNVLVSGNVGAASVIKPKEGLNNYTGIQNFIREQISAE